MFTNNDKDNQVREYNTIMHISLGFVVYNNHPCPQAPPWSQVLIDQWDCKISNYYIALPYNSKNMYLYSRFGVKYFQCVC